MSFNQNLPTKRTRKKGIQTSFQIMQTTKKRTSSQETQLLLVFVVVVGFFNLFVFVLPLIFSPWKRWLYVTYHNLVERRQGQPNVHQELGICLRYRQVGNPHRATARASSWGMEGTDGVFWDEKIGSFPSGFRCFPRIAEFFWWRKNYAIDKEKHLKKKKNSLTLGFGKSSFSRGVGFRKEPLWLALEENRQYFSQRA